MYVSLCLNELNHVYVYSNKKNCVISCKYPTARLRYVWMPLPQLVCDKNMAWADNFSRIILNTGKGWGEYWKYGYWKINTREVL